MLVTRRNDGELHARPMHIGMVDDSGKIYFLSPLHSQKIDEIIDTPQATAIMQQPGMFLALNGECRVRQDDEMLSRVAPDPAHTWAGADEDDSLVIIEFAPHAAEYWNVRGPRRVRDLVTVARRTLTRDVLSRTSSTEHERVPINF